MSDVPWLHRPSDPDEDGERECVYCADLWGCGCCGGDDPNTPMDGVGVDLGWPCPTVRQGPPERAILQDLIAELVGDDGDGHEMTPDGEACAVCVAIDRAEARLRDVSMSLSKGHDDE